MSNQAWASWPSGQLQARVFLGGWAGIDSVRAKVVLRGSLAIAENSTDIEVTGLVQLSGPWVRVAHDEGVVVLAFDQVSSIVELPED